MFLSLLIIFVKILPITSLVSVNPEAFPVETRTISNLNSVIDSFAKVEVLALKTRVSTLFVKVE